MTYDEALKARNALADKVTGEQGYTSARDAGIANIKRLMAARVNNALNRGGYGVNNIANFQQAIQGINPDLYDQYANMDAMNKQALQSQNKVVGEEMEQEFAKTDRNRKIAGAAIDAARSGLQMYATGSGSKPTMEQNIEPEGWQDRIKNSSATDDDMKYSFDQYKAGKYNAGPKTQEYYKTQGWN